MRSLSDPSCPLVLRHQSQRHRPLKKRISWVCEAHCEIIRSTVTCGIVSSPPGADAGKKAEAADREELRKYYIPGTAAALGVLLSGIAVSCIVISRRRKRDP